MGTKELITDQEKLAEFVELIEHAKTVAEAPNPDRHGIDFEKIWPLFFSFKSGGRRKLKDLAEQLGSDICNTKTQKHKTAADRFYLSLKGCQLFLQSIHTNRGKQHLELLTKVTGVCLPLPVQSACDINVKLKHFFDAVVLSADSHPIDFDDVWPLAGFTRKDTAIKKMKTLALNAELKQVGVVANRKVLKLTLTGLKRFCFGVPTDQAKKLLAYYLRLEKAGAFAANVATHVATHVATDASTAETHAPSAPAESAAASVTDASTAETCVVSGAQSASVEATAPSATDAPAAETHAASGAPRVENDDTILSDDLKREMEPYFQEFIHSTETHPVDFDMAWQWLGYATKANAKRLLKLAELKKEIVLIASDKHFFNGGQNREIIKMTVDGFKTLCHRAQTSKGRLVFRFYLDLEKAAAVATDAPAAESTGQLCVSTEPIADDTKAEMEQYFRGYIASTDRFPIDFDTVWPWLGYSRKDNAKRLLKLPELEGEIIFLNVEGNSGEGIGDSAAQNSGAGRPTEIIKMTVDGFKIVCLIAQTDRARIVRQHYLMLEKSVHALKRAIDTGEVALTPGEAARKRARVEAAEDRQEALAIAEHEHRLAELKAGTAARVAELQLTAIKDQRSVIDVYRDSLGELDGRDKIVLKDLTKRMLNPTSTLAHVVPTNQLAVTGGATPQEISIQIVAVELGVPVANHASAIGRAMARRYRERYNKEPTKRRVLYHGRPLDENAYFDTDRDLMVAAIKEVVQ